MSEDPGGGSGYLVAGLCDRFGQRLDELVGPGALTLWSADEQDLVGLVRAAEVLRRRAEALQVAAVAEAARRDLAATVGATSTPAWLSGVLTQPRRRAAATTRLATSLDHGVDATVAAFGAGRLDADQARVIAEAVARLPVGLGAEVVERGERPILAWAGEHDAEVLAGLGQHLLAHLAPEVADAAEAEALARPTRAT